MRLLLIQIGVLQLADGYASSVGVTLLVGAALILTFIHVKRLLQILEALVVHGQHVDQLLLL